MTTQQQAIPALGEPMQLGSLTIANRTMLAPLAGVSDVPFRLACQELGAGLTYVEMLAANLVLNANRHTVRRLKRDPAERILGVQVSGPNPEMVGDAVRVLDGMGFDTIDINMGCPIRKIVARGWGSAILCDPERVTRTVTRAREATRKPLSVKIRLGFTREARNTADIVARIVDAGADMLTIHGRTRDEHYGTPADWEAIRAAAELAHTRSGGRMLVVANGDVLTVEAARDVMTATGCDAVMVARGALGNPWIFRDIVAGAAAPQAPDTWLAVVLRHLDRHARFYRDTPHAVALFRKHLLWYVQGYPGCCRLRDTLGVIQRFDELRTILIAFADDLPPDAVRIPGFTYNLNQEAR